MTVYHFIILLFQGHLSEERVHIVTKGLLLSLLLLTIINNNYFIIIISSSSSSNTLQIAHHIFKARSLQASPGYTQKTTDS